MCCLERAVNYFQYNGREHQYRVFPWSVGFNPNEETSKAAVWISLPKLSPELFARQALLSIVAAVGKPIAIDKATQVRSRATQVRSRPSITRVKVIVDLLDELPENVRLRHVDSITSKIVEDFQQIIYDNLPSYCCHFKHQGHEERECHVLKEKIVATTQGVYGLVEEDGPVIKQLQGDARDYLNAKK